MAKNKNRSGVQVVIPDFVPAYHLLWGFSSVDHKIIDRLPEPLNRLQFEHLLSVYIRTGHNKFTFWYLDPSDGFVLSPHIFADFFIA